MNDIVDTLRSISQDSEAILGLTDEDWDDMGVDEDLRAWIIQIVEEINECASDLLKKLQRESIMSK